MNITYNNKSINNKSIQKKSMKKILKINNRGIIFTIDTLLTTIILLIILLSFSIILFQIINNNLELEKQFFLEQKTIAIADAIVKNNNSNALLGMSKIDFEKKRVLSNNLTLSNNNFTSIELNDFFIKEVSYLLKNKQSKTIFLNKKTFSNCFAVQRFVLIEKQKGLIKIVGCYE